MSNQRFAKKPPVTPNPHHKLEVAKNVTARTIHVTIQNLSGHDFILVDHSKHPKSKWNPAPPRHINYGNRLDFEVDSDSSWEGAHGWALYKFSDDSSKRFYFQFEDPYIGSNYYSYNTPSGYGCNIKGGAGEQARVTFECWTNNETNVRNNGDNGNVGAAPSRNPARKFKTTGRNNTGNQKTTAAARNPTRTASAGVYKEDYDSSDNEDSVEERDDEDGNDDGNRNGEDEEGEHEQAEEHQEEIEHQDEYEYEEEYKHEEEEEREEEEVHPEDVEDQEEDEHQEDIEHEEVHQDEDEDEDEDEREHEDEDEDEEEGEEEEEGEDEHEHEHEEEDENEEPDEEQPGHEEEEENEADDGDDYNDD